MPTAASVQPLVTAVLFTTLAGWTFLTAEALDGLYLSNSSNILFIQNPLDQSSSAVSVYKSEYGRIVGLAYDLPSKLLFWSNIDYYLKGIYQAPINTDGSLGNASVLVNTDIMEVNGLSVDWFSHNIYWTDGRKKTVEVLNFKSFLNPLPRRVLIMDGLLEPRGIYADPINGYLFWNDQGRNTIERSMLDGTNRQLIVNNTKWPNQMVVSAQTLYWVDSYYKVLRKCDLNGTNPIQISSDLLSLSNIFGVAIVNGSVLVTNWIRQIVQFDVGLTSAGILLRTVPGSDSLFSAVYYSAGVQVAGVSKCTTASCSHLCLPVSKTDVRCSCPSFGALVLRPSNNITCQKLRPAELQTASLLLYALADSGYVGYYDPSSTLIQQPFIGSTSVSRERYLIGRSLRPVGVAYDPRQNIVYWSDVTERVIYSANIDGTNQNVFLGSERGIGVVDGMILDSLHRQLYYTNFLSVRVDGSVYAWNKIETIQLESPNKIRTITTMAEQPRALTLDPTNGYLYYTTWGDRARIVRTNLDGSAPKELRSGLNNPNGLALVNGRVYYTDSNYKTRQNVHYPGPVQNGSLYSMSAADGSNWVMESTQLLTPYGLTSDGKSTLYISDWDLQQVISLNTNDKSTQILLDKVQSPMMLLYNTGILSGLITCGPSSCGDICLSSPPISSVCTCNSYSTEALAADQRTCNPKSVGFITVGDMNSLKQYSLDGVDMSVYTAVQGIPYTSNIVGVAYDSLTDTIFYSDVNSKWIMAMTFGSTATRYFQINNIIDGMTVDVTNRRLLWTDSMFNQILYLNIPSDRNRLPSSFGVVITNLNRPRAIKIYGGFLYWTEWGDVAVNRVSKLALSQINSSSPQPIQVLSNSNPVINWANGIFIDENNGRLYVADGHPKTKRVLNCSLSQGASTDCQELTGLTPTLAHIYDIWVYNDIVYYSDWKSGAVIAYSVAQNESWAILQGLMRPSQMFFKTNTSYSPCRLAKGGCSDICVPLLGSPGCACYAGRTLSADDQKTCVNSAKKCSAGNMTSLYDQIFLPSSQLCVDCQCLENSTKFIDITYYAAKCNRYGACQTPVCGGDGSTRLSDSQCCPVCVTNCTLKITNCPTQQINITLQADQSLVVYDYLPSVRDCSGLSREIGLVRNPAGALYNWTGAVQNVTVTASVVNGGTDSGSCTYSILVADVTPPTITCPTNVTLYTPTSSVAGIWNSPAVNDNVGVQPYSPSITWGSDFPLGITPVTYKITDLSGNTASCSFNVTVKQIGSQQCAVPSLNNGQLFCSGSSDGIGCTIQCDDKYRNTLNTATITCSDGKWSPALSFFQISTCIRFGPKAASGNITAIGRNACGPNIRLQYTVDFIQAKIKEKYLWLSTFNLTSSTRVSGCNGQAVSRQKRDVLPAGTNDVKVFVVISGVYYYDNDQQNLIANIDAILQLIYDDLNRAFLILTYSDDNGVHTTLHPDVVIRSAVPGCLEGTILLSDGFCGLCPTGMFTQDRVTCYPCANATYNEYEAQEQCPPCPSGQTSIQGSYIRYLCQDVKSSSACPVPCIIGLSVGLGGGLLLILIIVVIVLAVLLARKRRKQPVVQDNRNSQNFNNGGYDKGEEYDQIEDDYVNHGEYEKNLPVEEESSRNPVYSSVSKAGIETLSIENNARETMYPSFTA